MQTQFSTSQEKEQKVMIRNKLYFHIMCISSFCFILFYFLNGMWCLNPRTIKGLGQLWAESKIGHFLTVRSFPSLFCSNIYILGNDQFPAGSKYSGFTLFVAVSFCKVVINTEFVSPEPLFLKDMRGDFPVSLRSQRTLLPDHYLTLFYVCFCLKTSYLIYFVDWHLPNGW